jgi:hypothetical protein
MSGTAVPEPPSLADLRRGARFGREGHDPPVIHDDIQSENLAVERLGICDVLRRDVRHDPFDCH